MAGLEEPPQRPPLAVTTPSFELLRPRPAAAPGLPNPDEGESEGSQRPSKDTSTCFARFSTLCRITVVVEADGGVLLRCSCALVALSSEKQADSTDAEGLVLLLWSLEEEYSKDPNSCVVGGAWCFFARSWSRDERELR